MRLKKISSFVVFLLSLLLQTHLLRADSPPDLDNWLTSHPDIAQAIIWEFPDDGSGNQSMIGKLAQQVLFTLQPPFDPGIYENRIYQGIRSLSQRITSFVKSTPTLTQALALNGKKKPQLMSLSKKVAMAKPQSDLESNLGPSQLHQLGLSPKSQPHLPPLLPPSPPPAPAEQGASALNWNQFPDEKKQIIRDAYASSWTWIENCWPKYQEYFNTNVKPADFDVCFSTAEPANYPPTNLQWLDTPPSGVSTWTVISSNAAFDLFAKMVGLSLVLEIKGNIVPWTINELTADYKKEILNGSIWFRYVPVGDSYWGKINFEGYLIATTVIPAPATLTFSFLAQNKLIGSSKLDTATRVFTWERDNMWHTFGGNIHNDCPYQKGGFYTGGYMGEMPLSRVINGTQMPCPMYFSDGQGGESPYWEQAVHHWTGGCGGTSGFNEQVFRITNIPAQRTSYGHFQNNFILDNNDKQWIAHADDTYGTKYSVWNGVAEIPIVEIFVPDATYKTMVVDYDYDDPNLTQAQKDAYAAQNEKAVGKPTTDLMIKYLPKGMLQWYCWYDQGVAPDQTYMWDEYYKDQYTMADLNAMYISNWGTNTPGVFANMDLKLASLGGCKAQWP